MERVTWEPYASPGDGSVVGDLRVARGVQSPQLGRELDVLAWLPPSYPSRPERRYGVLYLWDAQNLFDATTSNIGEWCVDETMTALAAEGLEWIVVGLPHGGDQRSPEYSPWTTPFAEGKGEASLAFLLETVKPEVDASFRTLPDAWHTALGGSSLGGLMALYGHLTRPDAIGRALVMSPALMTTGGRVFDLVERTTLPSPTRVWMDAGDAEGEADEPDLSAAYVDGLERVRELLLARGYDDECLRTLVEPGGTHRESAWARRLPDALRFLLA